MAIYISMLRGINVSGHNRIKMDDLRKMFENMGFNHINTYLQSGNIVFESEETTTDQLEQKITDQLKTEFGYDVPVIVLTAQTLKEVINLNPYTKDPNKDPAYFHITFLSAPAGVFDPKILENKKLEGEEITISDKAIYLYCPKGYGKTKLNNNYLESKLKVKATTRNWKTTQELHKIAEKKE